MRNVRQLSKPLIYSCSGCSSSAQLANHIAVRMDREGHADMSCIAGVGGDVPGLVKLAKSGRPIVAVDGCHLHCALNCLKRHGIVPARHEDLSIHGVKKVQHGDFDPQQAREIFERVSNGVERLAAGLPFLDPNHEADTAA